MHPRKTPDELLAARIKRREALAVQGPIAMAEYRARQEEAISRMEKLREARLAREESATLIDPPV